MDISVSVIVPVFNMASDGKLVFCLESLLNQTRKDIEIIAVDDCSTDESYKILQKYGDAYPEIIKVFKTPENLHQGGARNLGLVKAKGRWISFIDADDWVAQDYYEKLLSLADKTGADAVGCDYCMVKEHKFTIASGDVVDKNSEENQIGIQNSDTRKSMILSGGSLCVKLFRRDMIIKEKLYFPEKIFYEDNAMSNSYLLNIHHYEYLQEPLYFYYQHDSSTVHSITVKNCEDRLDAGRLMIKEAKNRGFYEEYKEELEYKFTSLFYINTLFTYMPGVRPASLKWISRLTKEMKETFPDFQNNRYYLTMVNKEERKLIGFAAKSTLFFLLYYRALWLYRNIRIR